MSGRDAAVAAAEQARPLEQARGIAAELEGRLAAVMALHTSSQDTRGVVSWDYATGTDRPYCDHCHMFWPCPTLRAAETAEPTP